MAVNAGTQFWRIPAITRTVAGTLVAAWDARNGSNQDLPNNIDVVCSRSVDGGESWTPPTVLSAHTGGNTASTANGSGDTCLVVDPATGRIFAHYLYAPAGLGYANSSPGTAGTVRPSYRWSDDDGVTWSPPVDLTEVLKTPDMYGIFATSGHGWVTADGTVCVPYVYSTTAGGGVSAGFVAYTSDHGVSWQKSPAYTAGGPNESHGVQLADGTFLVSARPPGGSSRLFYTAPTLTGGWTFTPQPGLPDPSCNGDLLRVDGDGTARESWLLASGCASTSTRSNLTVWLSKDNGVSWPYTLRMVDGFAAYSTLVPIAGDVFGMFWEDNSRGRMQFTRFNINQVR